MHVPTWPCLFDDRAADIATHYKVGVKSMVGLMPFGYPEIGEVATDRLLEFFKEGREMDPQLLGIVATLPGECECAESVELVVGAVATDHSSRTCNRLFSRAGFILGPCQPRLLLQVVPQFCRVFERPLCVGRRFGGVSKAARCFPGGGVEIEDPPGFRVLRPRSVYPSGVIGAKQGSAIY